MDTEGYIDVPGGKVWYGINEGNGPSIITVHGGPGFPHNYLEPILRLGRHKVIAYDQLGCGLSDRPKDNSLWTVERYVHELHEITRLASSSRFVLYGHSWGSILVVEYYLQHPDNILASILAGPCLSVPIWKTDMKRLIVSLSEESQKAIHNYESTGDTDTQAFEAAVNDFNSRYVCRLPVLPDCYLEARRLQGNEVYEYLWGKSEFAPNGALRNFDCTMKLNLIKVPVLFTCGEFDEATPETTRLYAKMCPGSKVEVIPKASHMPHLEAEESYKQILIRFLEAVI